MALSAPRPADRPAAPTSDPGSDGRAAGADSSPTVPRGAATPVLMVTRDDDLWMRVSGAAPTLRLEQHDSVEDLVDVADARRAAVVLLDARADLDLAAALERLAAHSAALVPVAIVGADTADAALGLERRRALFDHVQDGDRDGLDAGTLLTIVERAAEEALARPPGGPGASAASERAASRTSATTDDGGDGRGRLALAAGLVGLALVAAGIGWWSSRESPRPAPAAPDAAPTSAAGGDAPAEAVAEDPRAAEEIERLLARGRAAVRDKRFIDPDADNALAHFRAVLAFDPANGEARQGLQRIAEVLVARAESELAARDNGAALRALEVARSLDPDHPRLAALDAQVGQRAQELALTQFQAALQANAFERAGALLRQAEARGAITATQAAQLRQEVARRQANSEVAELVRLAQARLAQGRLLEPANDSARHYLAQLAAKGAEAQDDHARLRADWLRRLQAETRTAIGRAAWPEAEALVAELRAAGLGAAPLAALQRELGQAQQQARGSELARYVQLAQERLGQRRLLQPEDGAVHWYRLAQSADPRHAALPMLREGIAAALLDQARRAYDSDRAADAQPALDAAREFGVPASTLAAVQAAGQAAVAAARAPVVATPPRLLRALAPQYPSRAAAAGTEGWVEVEFLVTAEGEPQNPRVVAAEPAGVFDSAALAAVRRARFEPARTGDGAALAAESRLRVRFALQGER